MSIEGFVAKGQAAQKAVDQVIAATATNVTLDDLAAAVLEIRRAERRVATQRKRLAEQEALLRDARAYHTAQAERYAQQDVSAREEK